MRRMSIPSRPIMFLVLGLVYLGQHMVWWEETVLKGTYNMAKECYDGFYLEPLNGKTKTMLRRGHIELSSLSYFENVVFTNEIIKDVHKYHVQGFCNFFFIVMEKLEIT